MLVYLWIYLGVALAVPFVIAALDPDFDPDDLNDSFTWSLILGWPIALGVFLLAAPFYASAWLGSWARGKWDAAHRQEGGQ